MKKEILTLAMLAALFKANAQEIDSTKIANDKIITQTSQADINNPAPVDNFSGNIEFIAGSNKSPYNTYVRPNIFFNLPGGISGYDWTEFYTDGTICGRNTLSKTIVGKLGVENQLIYITGIPVFTGFGLDYTFTPTKDVLIKPYFTPVMFNQNGIVENTSITGVYFTAKPFPNNKTLKNVTVSGFGEMNFSAKIDENDNGTTKDDKLQPTWSYGELCVGYAIPSLTDATHTANSHFTVEYVPSLTCKGPGKAAPQVNHRIGVIYNF